MVDSATVVGGEAPDDQSGARSRGTGDRETSVRRSLEVLLSLGSEQALESGGLGVTRIADLLGREKSQISRTLKTLSEFGLVDRDPDSLAYRLGWRIYALATLSGERRLLDAGRPVLERLVTAFEERAFLSVAQGVDSLTILSESSQRSVQASGWVGRTVPMYCTSVGQALLFDHDSAGVKRYLSGVVFERLTPATAPDIDAFVQRVEASRERGYAIADEELESGHLAIAAPVRDGRSRIVAAVNVSGPKYRLDEQREAVGQALIRAARDLTAALSGTGNVDAP